MSLLGALFSLVIPSHRITVIAMSGHVVIQLGNSFVTFHMIKIDNWLHCGGFQVHLQTLSALIFYTLEDLEVLSLK